jgi:ABC-type lipoprotein export system ATPase subunit
LLELEALGCLMFDLVAEGLGFVRQEAVVLNDLTFVVAAGEPLAITGASGAGKTTLLDCLGGLLRPTTGRVQMGDFDVGAATGRQVRRWRLRHVGMVFQFAELLPELTLRENTAMPLLLTGTPASSAYLRAAEALERLGLAPLGSRQPSQVSGGERQRAAIARAIVAAPSLILADEPTGSLNPALALEVARLLVATAADLGAVLVLATHNPQVAALCPQNLDLASTIASLR